jgi:hypothetical protein
MNVRKELHKAAANATINPATPNADLIPWFIAEQVSANDAALCRNTKPLVETAYQFFRHGVRA